MAASSSPSITAVRAVVVELRSLGVENPAEDLRVGSVVMARECIAAYRSREKVTAGWLWAALRAGGQWASVQGAAAAAPQESGSRFSEYDRAAGLL